MRDNKMTMGIIWGNTQPGKQDKKQLIRIHKERLDYGKHRGIQKPKHKKLNQKTENTDLDTYIFKCMSMFYFVCKILYWCVKLSPEVGGWWRNLKKGQAPQTMIDPSLSNTSK